MRFTQKRTNEIKLRLSDIELSKLNQRCSVCKCSREKYIRMVLEEAVVHIPPPLPYYDLIKEINAIGNNLNQLVKIGHIQGLDIGCVEAIILELKDMIQKLDQTIRGC